MGLPVWLGSQCVPTTRVGGFSLLLSPSWLWALEHTGDPWLRLTRAAVHVGTETGHSTFLPKVHTGQVGVLPTQGCAHPKPSHPTCPSASRAPAVVFLLDVPELSGPHLSIPHQGFHPWTVSSCGCLTTDSAQSLNSWRRGRGSRVKLPIHAPDFPPTARPSGGSLMPALQDLDLQCGVTMRGFPRLVLEIREADPHLHLPRGHGSER